MRIACVTIFLVYTEVVSDRAACSPGEFFSDLYMHLLSLYTHKRLYTAMTVSLVNHPLKLSKGSVTDEPVLSGPNVAAAFRPPLLFLARRTSIAA